MNTTNSICFCFFGDFFNFYKEHFILLIGFRFISFVGDGKLSQEEFIGIMKDRLKRGFGVSIFSIVHLTSIQ